MILVEGAVVAAAITFFINGNHDIEDFSNFVFDIVRDTR